MPEHPSQPSHGSHPASGSNQQTGGSATRTIAPLIPLAIALVAGSIGGSGTQQNSPAGAIPQQAITHTLTGGAIAACGGGIADSAPCQAPYPMLQKGHPVAWWFVFKFNASVFPGCGANGTRACPFGGTPQPYEFFGQQYAYASSEAPTLQQGDGCAGDTTSDPIGATFDEVFNNSYHYLIWNDQFYDDPEIKGCSQECGSPWGHSKGMLAWNDAGEGFVMQVSTPSWPAAGSATFPRKTDGNTLGCVKDNDVQVSQHFFALQLTKDDLVSVLKGLKNSSVVTDPADTQISSQGGPADVQQLVSSLGVQSTSTAVTVAPLSSGVQLISKPSHLNVAPWQMVSSVLGGISLRTATWWASPEIPSTDGTSAPSCWNSELTTPPGAVQIATTGTWSGKTFGLTGGLGTNYNHAKLGVSTSGPTSYAIFGDMNQQGTLSGSDCSSSQNGRGGMFYAVANSQLANSLSSLIAGNTAGTEVAAASASAKR